MRNGNKTRQISLAKIFVLALCFALVFAVALSASANRIAFAETKESEKDGDASFGSGVAIYGDHGELTGIDFNYPGTSANTTSWTCTETYNTVVSSTSNIQVYKETGDTKMFIETGITGGWQFGVSNAYAAAQCHGVININTSGFIDQMIQNDNVTVKATISMSLGKVSSYGNNKFYSAVAGPSLLTAQKSYQLREDGGDSSYSYNYKKSDKEASETLTTDTVTLDSNHKYLSLAMGLGWSIRGWPPYTPKRGIDVKNIKVTYTITHNGSFTDNASLTLGDNAAPVASSVYGVENSYEQGTSGSGYAPYVTDAKNSPVYYDSISKGIKTDSIVDGAGKLQSYTNTKLGDITVDGTSHAYYKFAQTEYVDVYNYSGEESIQSAITKYGVNAAKYIGVGDRLITGISDGKLQTSVTNDSTHLKYVSGIKTVTVNETVFNVWDSTDRAKTKAITVENDAGDQVVVGYAKLNYQNRGRVAVMIYMTTNGSVQTAVEDYGSASNKTRIEFSGIDLTSPTSNVVDGKETVNGGTQVALDNFVKDSASIANLAWYRQNTIAAEGSIEIVEDDTSAGYSPYVWFYTVNRADSLAALNDIDVTEFANYAAVKAAGINPIAYGEISSFTYDFANGVAKAYGGAWQGNPQSITDNVTGHGYYRFTFYIFDLAGNKGSVKSFYMKVDYDKPEYTLEYTVGSGDNATKINASDNGKWATDDVTLTFTLTAGGFSGYTFRFEDASGAMHALVVNGLGEYSGDEYVAALIDYLTTSSSTSTVNENKVTLNINGQSVVVTYSLVDGKSAFTFAIPAPSTAYYEWITSFSAFEGQYSNINAIDSDDQLVEYINNNWKGGVKVLIDKVAPTLPRLEDEEGYLSALTEYSIPTTRNWYTTSYDMTAILAFNDVITSSDYASGLKVHYAIKAIVNANDLNAFKGTIESKFASVDASKTDNEIAVDLGVDRYILVRGNELAGDTTSFEFNLLSQKNAGMRLLYVWVEDQAGNFSEINKYYIFVDANTYSVSASVKSNATLESGFASIAVTNEEGVAITQAKRGQTIRFNFNFANSYVPYAFTQNGNKLLENYTQNRVWTVASDNGNSQYLNVGAIDGDGNGTLTLVFDDVNDLSDMVNSSSQKKHAFELSARRNVTYTVTNRTVGYTASKVNVGDYTVPDYAAANNAFVYRFVDEDCNLLYVSAEDESATTTVLEEAKTDDSGNPVFFVPTNVGSYHVIIYIPKDNGNFVTDDFAMDESGTQIFTAIPFDIVKGKAVVTVHESTSQYGLAQSAILEMLTYDVSGIDKDKLESEHITVQLGFKTTLAQGATYAVGSYEIVNVAADSTYSQATNYEVIFKSAQHTVTPRTVVVDAWSASKQYKDNDPEFSFGVEIARFDNLYKSAEDIVAEIFDGYRKNEDVTESGYAIYFADGRISRVAGEGVGAYNFESNASLFDVNTNYSVTVQTSKHKFNVEKRVVTLDVSGQSSTFKFGTEINQALLSSIKPTYKISATDMVVASEIEALFANGATLTVAGDGSTVTAEGYSAAYEYAIALGGTLTDGNVQIALGEDTAYIVYVTEQGIVVVSVKDGVAFEFAYGDAWSANLITFDKDKFNVESDGDLPEYTDIAWTTSIANGTILGAGKYVVTITGATLKNGDATLGSKVSVEPITITVNPAKIVVRPTTSKTSKVYGEEESAFGIGFEIATVNGKAIATDGTYANVAYADILKAVGGAYVRAIFESDGTRVSFASRYDDTTKSDKTINGTNGRYYGIAVGTSFYSTNQNFTVVAQADADTKLEITPYELTMHTKYFVGIGKAYDETTDVPYGDVKMYLTSKILLLATDDVTLTASASYSNANAGERNITFEKFVINGTKAHNYTLAYVENDGKDSAVSGDDNGKITADTKVVIIWCNNEAGGDMIKISAGIIKVIKDNVTITKQYDNTNALIVDNIIFADAEGTKSLANAKKVLIEDESDSFSGAEVNKKYVVNVTVFFAFENIDLFDITYGDDPDIVITKDTYHSVKGITIELKNMSASITQRVLGKDSFESIKAIDHDYNASTNVDMTYTLKAGALADGDKEQTVGLRLFGKSASKDAGTYSVSVDSATVIDSNYTVDVASIRTAFTNLQVVISKARLIPDVTFASREYDGTSNVTVNEDELDGTFTTLHYADNLEDELEKITYVTTSLPKFALSLNGSADANVQANGMHNVSVSGLKIACEDESILKNYVLEGSRYSAVDKKYNVISDDVTVGDVADYEIIDAIELSKKRINLLTNDFDVKNKIYDGTTNASITITISETDGRIVKEHADLLEILATGNFARRQRGANIAINNLVSTLRIRDGLSDEDYALASEAIANYELVQFRGAITGDIVQRPLRIDTQLGEKEYNSDEAVIKSGIVYTFTNMVSGDEKYYAVQTKNGAYYYDKNVALKQNDDGSVFFDENGNVEVVGKSGAAYGLLLQNIKEKYDNYILVYSTNTAIAGKDAQAYLLEDGSIVYEKPADETTVKEFWYALETAKYYVLATDETTLASAEEANAVIGFYKVDGEDAYLVTNDFALDGGALKSGVYALEDETNYLLGEGKILRRTASIRASGIERIERADGIDVYTKNYDGTDIFFGKQGVDYKFSASAVSNVVQGDDVRIDNISAKFDSAFATAKYVVFTASGIVGSDAFNYTIEGTKASVEVKLSGKIVARTINAYLADSDAEYGVATGKYDGNVTYKLVGNDGTEYVLDNRYASDTAFYMNFKQYLVAVGFIANENDDIIDNASALALAKYTCNLDGDKYINAGEGEVGEYIRIGGEAGDRISSLPQAYVSFASMMPVAGSKSTSYVLKNGNASNYNFSYKYDGTDESTVTVVKKNLYVTTDTNAYTAVYGSFMTEDGKLTLKVGLKYLDKNGANGIVFSQVVNRLFSNGSTSYLPVVRIGLYDSQTDETTELTQSAKISKDLKDGQYYVLYLKTPDGFDSLTGDILNYNVIVAVAERVTLKDVDGVKKLAFDMGDVTLNTASVEIVLPEITDVSVGSDTENEFRYTFSIDGNGNAVNRLHDVIQGELDTDEIVFVDANGNELTPALAGTYSGVIKVKRYINANGEYVSESDKDDNGYFIEWNSGVNTKSVIIDKADVGLKATSVSEYYNGEAHSYASSGMNTNRISYNKLLSGSSTSGGTALFINEDYTISYERIEDDGSYTAVAQKDVVNAGKYRITVKLTDKFLSGTVGKNYNGASAIAELQVLRAIVNVKFSAVGDSVSKSVDARSSTTTFTGEYSEGATYIDYTVAMDEQSSAAPVVQKDDTKLVGLDDIRSAGRYPFTIELVKEGYNPANYVFYPGFGTLELSTKQISSVDGSSIEVTGGNGVVANRLEVKEIKSNHVSANDMSYLEAVEQYVEIMKQNANLENVRVAAVLRVNLYLNDSLVLLGDETIVTVALPDEVKDLDGKTIYYVNEKGGLTKLTDYTVSDGKLTYSTNYINGLVFVDTAPQQLEKWKVHTIILAAVLFAVLVCTVTIAVIVKKSKLKKLI